MTTADEPNMNTIGKTEVQGPTKAQNPIQIDVLIAVSIITVWTLYMVPSWQVPGDPFFLAAVDRGGYRRLPLAGIAGDEV